MDTLLLVQIVNWIVSAFQSVKAAAWSLFEATYIKPARIHPRFFFPNIERLEDRSLLAIGFTPVGDIDGIAGGLDVLSNPTSLQFGADDRLYVSEQDGTINAFTIDLQGGEFIATTHDELTLPGGAGVVNSIQNHNDDGTLNNDTNRQVTGLVVTGTAANPVLYVTSSDPRISFNNDANLDTNSGVVTQVNWTGSTWETLDIIRGLPRSEENHSNNGLVLSDDGTKLYVQVGGNTNNGAPSNFFSYTAEYALSGVLIEIDLTDIESRPVLSDPAGGQGGVSRNYVYDLPTLDDPSVANDGTRESASGMDVSGPWGGNDGLNMAILPSDAPMRIFADGFRNQYDIVLTQSGKFFTVDNGSNAGLGSDPNIVGGEAVSTPSNGGAGDPEPLFRIDDGNFYGHPNPLRSNQDQAWNVYDDSGNPDQAVSPNSVPDISDRVPSGVNIPPGFLIDPSKFTGDTTRLAESGVRVPFGSAQSKALTTLGSSSNGLTEYTSNAFGGALQGALLVTQFNDNVTAMKINSTGSGLDPIIDPGADEILGTGDDVTIAANGVYQLPGMSNLEVPLDVTVGPFGTIWVAKFGLGTIGVYEPTVLPVLDNSDIDNDGILNTIDPFMRDASNGGSVTVFPGNTLRWDFDANQDGNRPGPSGYGGGLTGVMVNGTTDFEEFFQAPSSLPNQIVNLDNVKFTTAAGGGTTVIENVSNGDAQQTQNDGEFLFHTGVTIPSTVETVNVKWSVFNPGNALTGNFQQIGGYLGTGDQSNYLKVAAIQDGLGEILVSLEDNDIVVSNELIQADDLFDVVEAEGMKIFFEILLDVAAETATPTITYETSSGQSIVSGSTISLAGTAVLDAIKGNFTIHDQTTGLAVGLFSTNTGQPAANSFQAIFDDIEVSASGGQSAVPIYRVNAGGGAIESTDSGPNWSGDTLDINSPFLSNAGSNSTGGFLSSPGATVPVTTPAEIFEKERWDANGDSEMQWSFPISVAGLYEVRLYMGNGYFGTNEPGERIFDVSIEGNVPENLDDLDLSGQFGHQVGAMIPNTALVTDGALDIEFIHGTENPLINGIEIIHLGSSQPWVSIVNGPVAIAESAGQAQVSLQTDRTLPVGETVMVTYEVVPDSASAKLDYDIPEATFDSGTQTYTDTVSIAGGMSQATVLIDILQEMDFEGDEDFHLTITGVSANANIGIPTTPVTIINDDDPPLCTALYRVNAGGRPIASIDSGPDWSGDKSRKKTSPYLSDPGSNSKTGSRIRPGATVPTTTPSKIFRKQRWDREGGSEMQWSFPTPASGLYEVRLYLGNGKSRTKDPGERIFDVSIEGSVPANLDDVDLSGQFGHKVGVMISNTVRVTDGALDIEFIHGIEDPVVNGIEIIQVSPCSSWLGAAELAITADSNDVQISTFTNNSVQITNTGTKDIEKVVVDVTSALFPDVVFDPFGEAGDTLARKLTITNAGGTGVLSPDHGSSANPGTAYIGTGGIAGFKAIQLLFGENTFGGFNPGETVAFAIDMDSNSIAGASKSILEAGTSPYWDVGGVSGAELIGSMFRVTFTDGTTATGELQGVNNQGGSKGVALQNSPDFSASLTVNGLSEGGVGTYGVDGPTVEVGGPIGETARVILVKGIIQPINNNFNEPYATQFDNQLAALAASDFPANNSAQFQTVDVILTGEPQDISAMFDFSQVPGFNLAVPEDQVPLGFVAGIIDPISGDLPLGGVSAPIYLQFDSRNLVVERTSSINTIPRELSAPVIPSFEHWPQRPAKVKTHQRSPTWSSSESPIGISTARHAVELYEHSKLNPNVWRPIINQPCHTYQAAQRRNKELLNNECDYGWENVVDAFFFTNDPDEFFHTEIDR